MQLLKRNMMINLMFFLFLLIQIEINLGQDGGYVNHHNYDNANEAIPDYVYQYRVTAAVTTLIITVNGIWMIHNCRRSPSYGLYR